ncbi:MAG: hypothetical protein VX278_11365 [Myxococcota bacterium]|nr:hypothetical protein [Myxococcota bacterium]
MTNDIMKKIADFDSIKADVKRNIARIQELLLASITAKKPPSFSEAEVASVLDTPAVQKAETVKTDIPAFASEIGRPKEPKPLTKEERKALTKNINQILPKKISGADADSSSPESQMAQTVGKMIRDDLETWDLGSKIGELKGDMEKHILEKVGDNPEKWAKNHRDLAQKDLGLTEAELDTWLTESKAKARQTVQDRKINEKTKELMAQEKIQIQAEIDAGLKNFKESNDTPEWLVALLQRNLSPKPSFEQMMKELRSKEESYRMTAMSDLVASRKQTVQASAQEKAETPSTEEEQKELAQLYAKQTLERREDAIKQKAKEKVQSPSKKDIEKTMAHASKAFDLSLKDSLGIRLLGGQESRAGEVITKDQHGMIQKTIGGAANFGGFAIKKSTLNEADTLHKNNPMKWKKLVENVKNKKSGDKLLELVDMSLKKIKEKDGSYSGGVLTETNWSLPLNINMVIGDVVAQKQIAYATEGDSLGPNADDDRTERQEWQRGIKPDGTFSHEMLISVDPRDPNRGYPNVKALEIKLLVLMGCEFMRMPMPTKDEEATEEYQLCVVPPDGEDMKALLAPARMALIMQDLDRFKNIDFSKDPDGLRAELTKGL